MFFWLYSRYELFLHKPEERIVATMLVELAVTEPVCRACARILFIWLQIAHFLRRSKLIIVLCICFLLELTAGSKLDW